MLPAANARKIWELETPDPKAHAPKQGAQSCACYIVVAGMKIGPTLLITDRDLELREHFPS
ncbi:hypothetical protein ACVIW0_001264 [Bradyrhizobium sp. USDA 4454]